MKATTRIKFGGKRPKDADPSDKSHLQTVQPGEEIPRDAKLSDEQKARMSVEEEFEPSFDPDDPESYAGEDAARDSKLMAPDNPNRPLSIAGEETWKVAQTGPFSRDARNLIAGKGGTGQATGQSATGDDESKSTAKK